MRDSLKIKIIEAVVAQLVEPQIVDLVVAGSNPVDRPIHVSTPSFTLQIPEYR